MNPHFLLRLTLSKFMRSKRGNSKRRMRERERKREKESLAYFRRSLSSHFFLHSFRRLPRKNPTQKTPTATAAEVDGSEHCREAKDAEGIGKAHTTLLLFLLPHFVAQPFKGGGGGAFRRRHNHCSFSGRSCRCKIPPSSSPPACQTNCFRRP
jgi:hypothetical protein